MMKFRVGDRVIRNCYADWPTGRVEYGVVTHSFDNRVFVENDAGREFQCYNPDHYELARPTQCPMEVII